MTNQFTNLLNDVKYLYDTPRIREKEVGDYLGKVKSKYPRKFYDDMSNDIRHAYTSAVLARDMGENVADWLGRANEWVDFAASGREDSNRDLQQNRIGRDYAKQYPDYTNQQLLEQLYQDYIQKYY